MASRTTAAHSMPVHVLIPFAMAHQEPFCVPGIATWGGTQANKLMWNCCGLEEDSDSQSWPRKRADCAISGLGQDPTYTDGERKEIKKI